ncbi:MAG: hypothetical protein WD638_12340 [Nitriliruptoraceae bacterium]
MLTAAILVSLTALSGLQAPAHAAAEEAITEDGTIEVLYFGSDSCPYCVRMQAYLDEVEERVGDEVVILRHEVSQDPDARATWERELVARGMSPSGVPTTIIGDEVWVGFDERVAQEVTAELARLIAVRDEAPTVDGEAADASPTPDDDDIDVPLFGEVELAGRSAVGVTALIALVDGFNPCSLWVLTVLLAMVLNAGASRTRVIAVGGTFLATTALLYGAFIAGLFTVLGLVERLGAIRVGVAVVALTVGAVNVKDYFAYKQGISFTIPDRFKPRIYRGGRAVRDGKRSLSSVLLTTVVLASGVALVELPCTAGFPVIWAGTLRTLGVEGGIAFAGLLALYLLIYVLDELLVFGVVVVTLRITAFEEKHGRLLKLIGGAIMVALGLAMLFIPSLLEDLGGLLALTAGSALLVVALVVAGRWLPRGRPAGGRRRRHDTPAGRGSARSGTRR